MLLMRLRLTSAGVVGLALYSVKEKPPFVSGVCGLWSPLAPLVVPFVMTGTTGAVDESAMVIEMLTCGLCQKRER